MKHLGKTAALSSLIVFNLISSISLSDAHKPKPKLLQVPIIRQSTPYSCGAAALQAVLFYWQVSSEGEFALHEPLQTDKENGTHPISILNYAKNLGLKAELKTQSSASDIEAAVDRKEPVIVDYQAWGYPENKDYSAVWDSGHYGVIVGYDTDYFYLMDPFLSASYGKIGKNEFQNRWHDLETRNGKLEYFVHSAIFISGFNSLKAFPSEIKNID